MTFGDSLTAEALRTGQRVTRASAPPGIVRLAITLPDGATQHFERPTAGDSGDWRATELEGSGSGFVFDEPITAEWGRGLDTVAATTP